MFLTSRFYHTAPPHPIQLHKCARTHTLTHTHCPYLGSNSSLHIKLHLPTFFSYYFTAKHNNYLKISCSHMLTHCQEYSSLTCKLCKLQHLPPGNLKSFPSASIIPYRSRHQDLCCFKHLLNFFSSSSLYVSES